MSLPPRSRPSPCLRAFSLVELLTVVAIAAMLGSMAMVSFGTVTSRNLDVGGNLVIDLAQQARQHSIAKNCMTAVVLICQSPNEQINRKAFTLLERAPGGTWSPVTPWRFLPTGIRVDTAASESAGFLTPPSLSEPIGPLRCAGTSLPSTTLAYQIFLPGGRMLDPGTTPALRLVAANGSSGNYYDVVFNVTTGIPKVLRP